MTPNQPDQDNSTLGKWMMMIAWLIGLGLLVLVFEDQLAEQINPNRSPESQVSAAGIEVKLKRNRQGHYIASGLINDQPVVFLLDTGATNVSVPMHLNQQLGLVPGERYMASTANGNVVVAQTTIDSLKIGQIELNNISANINPGMRSDEVLLGMSVLKQLEFTQRGEWLILKQL